MLNRFLPKRVPNDIAAAQAELNEAKLSHLKSRSDAEYSAASVLKHNAMAEFHQGRIDRLTAYIAEEQAKLPPDDLSVVELMATTTYK